MNEASGGALTEGLFLLAAFAAFLLLSKLYPRWPKAEFWLVGISLVAFVPVAAFVLFVVTNHRAGYGETLPWLATIAPLLGGLWWAIRSKTTLLSDRPLKAVGDATIDRSAASTPVRDDTPLVAAAGQSHAAPPAAKPQRPLDAVASNKIFVSYRRQDTADVTGRIYDRLVQHFDKGQVFKDVDSIPLGVDFREHLGSVVGKCDVLLAVVGNEWLSMDSVGRRRIDDSMDFVRIEIEAALARKIPVIPVLVRGASVPSGTELPASLAPLSYRNGIAVRADPDFHRDMDRLIAGLEVHLANRN